MQPAERAVAVRRLGAAGVLAMLSTVMRDAQVCTPLRRLVARRAAAALATVVRDTALGGAGVQALLAATVSHAERRRCARHMLAPLAGATRRTHRCRSARWFGAVCGSEPTAAVLHETKRRILHIARSLLHIARSAQWARALRRHWRSVVPRNALRGALHTHGAVAAVVPTAPNPQVSVLIRLPLSPPCVPLWLQAQQS
jgi:hypothetical protein